MYPVYKKKAEKYHYVKGADGMYPPWREDWLQKKLAKLGNGTAYWSGDATTKSVQFSFNLNKDGTIPEKRKAHLMAAIQRLEGQLPVDARVASDEEEEGTEDVADAVAALEEESE